ncbi:MAG: glycosyltransferase [Ruminococcaceae bacterium]|nr:glycosyltransferase [Oscillospiraceae bacterium]
MKKVLVMMSTYNGQFYLKQQLDSLISQEGVDLTIYIRDDGSGDNTKDIIKEYATLYPCIQYEFGENLGYAKSFWRIFEIQEAYDYYAFCDQDDVWKSDKLIRAITKLEEIEKHDQIPALYASDAVSVDNDMQVLSEKTFNPPGVLSFYRSLQISTVPGCTFVFNRYAFELASLYKGFMESHDWALYNIVSSFGKIVLDDESRILYRIHGNNTIGKTSRFQVLMTKIKRLFKKPPRTRSRFAKDFYDCYKDGLSAEYADAAYKLGYYRLSRKKGALLFDRRFKGLTFKFMVLLNRV